MAEASRQQGSIVATGSWAWGVLGILLGTATCISMVKNGFSIDLHGLPLKVYEQYVWLRDMLFEPVVWVLRYYGLTMPWWLKDAIMAYGLVASAQWRATGGLTKGSRTGGLPEGWRQPPEIGPPASDPWLSFPERLLRAAIWPVNVAALMEGFSKSEALRLKRIQDTRDTFLRNLEARIATETNPETRHFLDNVRKRHLAEEAFHRNIQYAMTKGLAKQAVLVILCAVAFFLWNYLQSTFGPGS